MELTRISVGEKFSVFRKRSEQMTDGAIFELLPEGGYVFVIYLYDMTSREKTLLRKADIITKVFKQDGFLLTLFRFGVSDIIFEVVFDPNLYQDGRELDLMKSNMVNVIGVDGRTDIVQTLRLVSTPMKLFKIWQETWLQSMIKEEYSRQYTIWLDKLYAKHTVMELWHKAKQCCIMGENESEDKNNNGICNEAR